MKIHVVLFSATETAVAARAPVLVVMPISEQFGASHGTGRAVSSKSVNQRNGFHGEVPQTIGD